MDTYTGSFQVQQAKVARKVLLKKYKYEPKSKFANLASFSKDQRPFGLPSRLVYWAIDHYNTGYTRGQGDRRRCYRDDPSINDLCKITRLNERTVRVALAQLAKAGLVKSSDNGWRAIRPGESTSTTIGPWRRKRMAEGILADEGPKTWYRSLASTRIMLPQLRAQVVVAGEPKHFTIDHSFVMALIWERFCKSDRDHDCVVEINNQAIRNFSQGLSRNTIHRAMKVLHCAGFITLESPSNSYEYRCRLHVYGEHPIFVGKEVCPDWSSGTSDEWQNPCVGVQVKEPKPRAQPKPPPWVIDPHTVEPRRDEPAYLVPAHLQRAERLSDEVRKPAEEATPKAATPNSLASREDVLRSCTERSQYGVWPSDAQKLWPMVESLRLSQSGWGSVVQRANTLAAEMTYSAMLNRNLEIVLREMTASAKVAA